MQEKEEGNDLLEVHVEGFLCRAYFCTGVRLSGGTFSGQLEMLIKGQWLKVCAGRTFNTNAGRIACRQLGLGDFVSSKKAPISMPWLTTSSVHCHNRERSLQECKPTLSCDSNGIVVLTCSGEAKCLNVLFPLGPACCRLSHGLLNLQNFLKHDRGL